MPDVLVAALQSLGGLGLFLLGMSLMTEGLKSLAGPGLRTTLRRYTRSPGTGALSGAALTTLVQSSSATTVTAVGLVGAGLLTFPHALGVIFGANLGTTATGWLVAVFGFKISLSAVAMPLVFVGALLRLIARYPLDALGRAIAGFAVIFIGLGVLQDGMASFQGVVTPESFPGDGLFGRLQLVGIGIVLTLVTQSSSAGVATAMTALHAEAIGLGQAAAMVIGMDIGTTVTAAVATIGGNSAVKRTGYAHVIYNVLTAMLALILLGPYLRMVGDMHLEEDPELLLVGFHTLFNGLGVLMVIPVTRQFAGLMERLVPAKEPVLTRRLERTLKKDPLVALDAVCETIHEIAAFSLAVLRPVFEGTPQGSLDVALQPAEQALREAHTYLGEVAIGRDKHASRRAVHVMLSIDHLDRVLGRLRQHERIETIVERADFRAAARTLNVIAERLEAWVRDPGVETIEADAESAWQELSAGQDSFRREVLEGAAAGVIDGEEALRRLDAMRWLVRVAHHLWRLTHHLEAARLRKPPPAEAPQAERESD